MAYIKTINSLAAFNELIASPKLTVVDYHAVWCGPCHTIAPVFQQLSTQFRHVNFAKVDVDQVKDVASKEGVTSMPTFKFYKNGNEIAKLIGANPGGLKGLVEQHAGTPEESGSSSLNVQGHSDINEFITLKQIDCLNQQENHNVRNIFNIDNTYLESDVDEQLLISIPFNQAVKIHSMKLVVKDIEHAPKTIKIYANRLNIGFDETDSIKETQVINLSKTDYENNDIIPLRFVKFQNVTNIALFVQDNLGDEETTIIKELHFIGSPVETTNIEQLKKIEQ
ncbi:PITH domain-containing protein [Glomus cerebriforme]|uniref:PITH domain-containing protein n=1 Tax=Glomus cerebriforme TaxID=658196 RepID=A0A397TD41_9GLOM|nr:PITH domain-containing protein [Glomus cerebriforme]